VTGFTVLGMSLILFSVTGSLWLALVLAAVVGLANVVFVVPSQTIFQQRTPDEMLGRVVAIRLALVNVMLAVSMATSGLFARSSASTSCWRGAASSPPPRAWPASPSAPSERPDEVELRRRATTAQSADRAMRKRRSVDSG